MLAIGWATLVLGLISGYEVARRVFQEPCRISQILAAPPIAVALLLLLGAYLRPYLSPAAVVWLLFILSGALLAAVRRLPLSDETPEPLPWPGWLYLLGGSLLAAFYALFERTTGMVVEGDFFVHVSSIGLFEEGHYPPRNLFIGVPAHGHFGRQLIIASLSGLSGLRFLEVDWLYTTLSQVCTFGLLFVIFWRQSRSLAQGVFASFFAFFAANSASRIGLADLVSNHNPTAFMFFTLTTWALFRALERGGFALVGAGMILGATATVYETLFGLMGLALPILLGLTFSDLRFALRRFIPIVLIAVALAATEGGTITEIASRALPGTKTEETNVLSQQVTLEIPKTQLFQVRYDNMRPSRPFETTIRPWDPSFRSSNQYYSVFSSSVLAVFWYPLWLSPLCFIYLIRKRHRAGVWFGTIAAIAWLIPCLVGFGFFEGEALRWLFVSALGGSVCSGLVMGIVWDRFPDRGYRLGVALFTLLLAGPGLWVSLGDMRYALANPGKELPIGRPGVAPGVGLIPRPMKLLTHHYPLTDEDIAAADWLREHSDPEARILADDDNFNVNVRCTMVGLEGRYPAAYLPPVSPSTDPSVYKRRLQVSRFWHSADVRHLQGLDFDWLLLHRSFHRKEIEESLGQSTWFEQQHSFGDITLYRCELPEPTFETSGELTVQGVQMAEEATCGEPFTVSLRLRNEGTRPLRWLTYHWRNSEGRLVGGPMWEPVDLLPGEERALEVRLVTPHESDAYHLELFPGREPGLEPQTLGEVKATGNQRTPESGG